MQSVVVPDDRAANGAIYFGWSRDDTKFPFGSGNGVRVNIDFDASRSSAIYGRSHTVQSPAIKIRLWRRTA